AFEFGLRRKQRQVTTGAGEGTLSLFLVERTRARPLGAVLAQDVELGRRQALAPLVIGQRLEVGWRHGLRNCVSAFGGKHQKSSGPREKKLSAIEHRDPSCSSLLLYEMQHFAASNTGHGAIT